MAENRRITHNGIGFDPTLRDELVLKWEEAHRMRKQNFSFAGKVFDTRYAGYLIEYLDTVFE